jgi:hypothetical protein
MIGATMRPGVGRPRYSQHHVAEATGSKFHARLSAV